MKNKILIITPKFFEYEKLICEAARKNGLNAIWFNSRRSDNILYKILLRIFPRLIQTIFQEYYRGKIQEIDDPENFKYVLVIKGDGLSRSVYQSIKNKFSESKRIYYSWDGMKNMRGVYSVLDGFDRMVTFDPVDAKTLGFEYLPLFSSLKDCQIDANSSVHQNEYTLSFVGTLHSDRYRVLEKVFDKKIIDRHFLFLYSRSVFVRFLHGLKNYKIWFDTLDCISNSPLSYEDFNNVLLKSRAVMDIELRSQAGLTMRSVETLLSGKKLVTTNASILDFPLYDPSRVLLVDRKNPKIDQNFWMTKFKPLSPAEKNQFLIENWFKELVQ